MEGIVAKSEINDRDGANALLCIEILTKMSEPISQAQAKDLLKLSMNRLLEAAGGKAHE
jgi:hypothetical protein